MKPKLVEPFGLYFASENKNLDFIHTGCTRLDCILGGGWVLGRIANIVGPKSVGKTLLAIEAAANFAKQYSNGKIYYRESEAAFDEAYAAALGMPLDRVEFVGEEQNFFTVEDFYNDLSEKIDKLKGPGLYILDSLDALSDKEEQDRKFGEATYAAGKAKRMGELFRKLIQKIKQSNMTLIIISQERDKLGVMFGKKVTRSGGGRALDFYLSQMIWLSKGENIVKKYKLPSGKERTRVIGINVKAKCEWNKVSTPFGECNFDILFGFGIDDFTTGTDWLKEVERFGDLQWNGEAVTIDNIGKYYRRVSECPDEPYWAEVAKVNAAVKQVYYEIEKDFLPIRKKYQ